MVGADEQEPGGDARGEGGAGSSPVDREPRRTLRLAVGAWVGLILLAAVCVPFALTHIAEVLKGVDEWTRDIRFLAAPDARQDENIVIIGVTDDTLDALSCRLPFDRELLAQIITRLDEAGARAIGIDFVLDNETDPRKDELLREVMRTVKTPVIPGWAGADVGTTGKRADVLSWFVGDLTPGYAMLLRDRQDGTVRYAYPRWDEGEKAQFQLGAAVAHRLGVDLPKERRYRIAWRGFNSQRPDEKPFLVVDAQVVPILPPVFFKDKIALIGPVLVDIDRHRTALTAIPGVEEMPGVEIHAHILSQILDGRRILEPGLAGEAAIGLALALVGMLLSMSRLSLWLKILLSMLVLSAFGVLCFALFARAEVMVPLVTPVLAFMIAAAGASAFVGRRERLLRNQIRRAFARYVPPGVVSRLDRDPSRLKLGGERRTITVMFTDIEQFTSSSEYLPPDLIGTIINDYFDGLGGIILAHGGTIDKFLGDGSMCFFGAPEASEDDAGRAVACAAALVEFGEAFRARWMSQGYRFGRTRVGLDTGPAFVGNFGGRDRFDYTAIGNVVNTAARLEAANKALGTRALLSKATVDAAPDRPVRPAGTLVLHGKQDALITYEPIDALDAASPYQAAYREAFQALDRESPAALMAFEDLARQRPDDRLVAGHLERLRGGETGAFIIMTSK